MERKLSAKRISEWLGVMLIVMITLIFLSSILLGKADAHGTGTLLFTLLFKIVIFVFPVAASLYLLRSGNYQVPIMKKTFSGHQSVMIVFSSVGSIICLQMLYGAVFPMTINTLGITADTKPVTLVLLFLVHVLAPAFLEEFFFRGVLMRALTAFRGLLAILISSLMFALMHISLYSFPLVFVCGFIIGVAYLSTGSLVAVQIIHLACNTFWFLSAVIRTYASSHAGDVMQILFGACVLMLAAGLPLLKMTFAAVFDDNDTDVAPSSHFWTVPMIVFLAVALAVNLLFGGSM